MIKSIHPLKLAISFVLGIAIGAACRALDIPSPAPTAINGALLVVAMTAGYVLVDKYLGARESASGEYCAGPDGRTKTDRS